MRPLLSTPLLLLSLTSLASASAIMTRRPDVVDARCRRLGEGRFTSTVYLSGRYEGAGSAPGGPVWRRVMPLKPYEFSITRRGCGAPEPGRWIRDGACQGLPRYRFSRKLKRRYSYEVHGGGSPVVIGRGAPSSKRCPEPKIEPEPIDELEVDVGFPWKRAVEVDKAGVIIDQGGWIQVRVPWPLCEVPDDTPMSEWARLIHPDPEALRAQLERGEKLRFEVEVHQSARRYDLDGDEDRLGRRTHKCARERKRIRYVRAAWSTRVAEEQRTLSYKARRGRCR